QGETGIKGPLGDTGLTGPQGPQGNAGAKPCPNGGELGTETNPTGFFSFGRAGVSIPRTSGCADPGPTGPTGPPRATGIHRRPGPAGATGIQGPLGDTGPDGAKGNVGATGQQPCLGGEIQTTVTFGRAGAASLPQNCAATGPTGPKGPQGDTGPQGTLGDQGAN